MSETWAPDDRHQIAIIARNLMTRYLGIAVEILLGLVTLPFNLRHLGQEAYGLRMRTASLTVHFSVLDLGFGGALLTFMAQYRAHRDTRALNDIVSTLFAGIGWPALWPAAVVAGCLIPIRGASSGRLVTVLIEATIACALYLALFLLIAVGRRDRALYSGKALELIGWRGHLAPAA